mmetsp:Transcript_28914/g.44450  ORF Transcript_28914/g.44450 Transcript_28914/m.44450 type:complete len:662 (+) Transcript_28914:100-2085(+)
MFTQYESQSHAGFGATSVVTSHGLKYDGNKWVASNSAVGSGTYSTAQHSATPPIPAANGTAAMYTQYYHNWKAQADQHRKAAEKLPEGNERNQALQRAKWADYYAEQSARMFHQLNGAVGVSKETNASLKTTASSTENINPNFKSPKTHLKAPQKKELQSPTKPQVKAPRGMMGYVNRCLSQCKSDGDKKRMRKALELVIKEKVEQGLEHGADWDSIPVVNLATLYETEKSPTDATVSSNMDNATASHETISVSKNELRTNTPSPAKQSHVKKEVFSQEPKTLLQFPNTANVSPSEQEEFVQLPTFSSESMHNQSKGKNKKKKRKHWEDGGFQRSSNVMAKRANRFSGRGGIGEAEESNQKGAANNFKRFMGMAVIGGNTKKLDEGDYEKMTVKGTCMILEKEYLRLTAPPRAEAVRPQNILALQLANLKRSWMSSTRKEYSWFCSQLKAIRQDLTVQRIFNSFSVDVYETHARIALEQGDVNEYNQCQTQLKELYALLDPLDPGRKNENEFIAYRLIYHVFLTCNKKYEGGSSDLFRMMLGLTSEQKLDPCVQHALKVRVAVAEYDYHSFFSLLDICPLMGAYLMDLMVPSVRYWALLRICKAYRPSIPISYVLKELGFKTEEEGREWLLASGCIFKGEELLTKESLVVDCTTKEKNSLI